MLKINGGIAMLNGLLLASYSVFCSCIMNGTCCGGVCECGEGVCCDEEWHTDEGKCCGNVWHPASTNLCGEGNHLVYQSPYCCGCLEDTKVIGNLCCEPGIPLHEKQDGDCKQRCCDEANPGNCTDEYEADCTETSLQGSCSLDGCQRACCAENEAGTQVTCINVDGVDCVKPAYLEPPTSQGAVLACGVAACLGQCCKYVDDVYTATGVVSLADCIASGGEFQGIGTTVCLNCEGDTSLQSYRCRQPFNACCCEEKINGRGACVYRSSKQRPLPTA